MVWSYSDTHSHMWRHLLFVCNTAHMKNMYTCKPYKSTTICVFSSATNRPRHLCLQVLVDYEAIFFPFFFYKATKKEGLQNKYKMYLSRGYDKKLCVLVENVSECKYPMLHVPDMNYVFFPIVYNVLWVVIRIFIFFFSEVFISVHSNSLAYYNWFWVYVYVFFSCKHAKKFCLCKWKYDEVEKLLFCAFFGRFIESFSCVCLFKQNITWKWHTSKTKAF